MQEKSQNKTGNKFFERLEEVRYLGTTATNQNSIHDEIKSIVNSGKDCSHSPNTSVQTEIMNLSQSQGRVFHRTSCSRT
jgi:broad-specificity NMP kinase